MLYLVQFDFNYADEFDTQGFTLYTENEYKTFLVEVRNRFKENKEVTKYFGTNECIEFESEEEYLDGISHRIISGEEWDFIVNTFGKNYGMCMDITE